MPTRYFFALARVFSILVFALSLGALMNCTGKPMTVNLYDALSEKCPPDKSSCLIDLATITSFQWDRVVFVKMTAATQVVAANIGVDIPGRQEFEDLILFLEGGKIVETVRRKYHPEKPFKETVFLDFSSTGQRFLAFPAAEATFIAKRMGARGDNFLLFARSDAEG